MIEVSASGTDDVANAAEESDSQRWHRAGSQHSWTHRSNKVITMDNRSYLARHLDPNPDVIRPTLPPPAPIAWKRVLMVFGVVVLLMLGTCEGFLRFAVTVCRNAGMEEVKCGPAPGWKPLILHDITGDAAHRPGGPPPEMAVAVVLNSRAGFV
jgi:hypothetical protein